MGKPKMDERTAKMVVAFFELLLEWGKDHVVPLLTKEPKPHLELVEDEPAQAAEEEKTE